MKWLAVPAAIGLFAIPLTVGTAFANGHNCENYPSQAAAQAALRENPSDPDGLDGPPGPTSAGIPGVACESNPGPRDEVPVQVGGAPAAQASGGAAPQVTSNPKAGGVPIAPISLLAASAIGAGVGLRRFAR